MTAPTAEDVDAVLAGEMGLEVGAVTKRTKLVIAADPDSLSGGDRKARDRGIPIVDGAYDGAQDPASRRGVR